MLRVGGGKDVPVRESPWGSGEVRACVAQWGLARQGQEWARRSGLWKEPLL